MLVHIVEDHPLVTSALSNLIDDSSFSLGSCFSSAKAFKAAASKLETGIILMDLNLPDGDGLDLLLELKEEQADQLVVVLSSFDKEELIRTAFQHGAKAYLCKDVDSDELLLALKEVAAGEEYLEKRLEAKIGSNKPSKEYIPVLTKREKELLALVIKEHTTAEIATLLFISPKTAENYRLNLLQKLGARNTAGLVRMALEKGLHLG